MNRTKYLALAPILGLAFALGFTVSASPGHGNVTVSAAAFNPRDYSYQFVNVGNALQQLDGYSKEYYASVCLPQGAEVTKLTFHFFDSSVSPDDWVYVRLQRNNLIGTTSTMAQVYSTDVGVSSAYTDTIDYATIDNAQYGYYLHAALNTSSVSLYAVTVEYTYQTSLPAVLRNLTSVPRGY